MQTFIAASVYLTNFQQYYSPTMLGYYWSLAVEWQFYVVFPLLLILLRNDSHRIVFLLFVLSLSIYFVPGGSGWWMFRFDGIVFGILAYYLLEVMKFQLPQFRILESSVGAVITCSILLVALVCFPLALQPYRLAVTFANLIGGILVVLAAANRGYITAFGMPSLVRWIGSRSYTIYLCHIPALLIVRSLQAYAIGVDGVLHPTVGQAVTAVLLIFALLAVFSEFGFRMIERPSHIRSHEVPLPDQSSPQLS